jgi:hypothetical protein
MATLSAKDFFGGKPAQSVTSTTAPETSGHLDGFTTVDQHERGFLGNLLPAAFAVGGGILGGIAGAAPTFGVGAIPGAIAGATGGGALGEGIQQGIENVAGERKGLNPAQIGIAGAGSGLLEAATAGIGAVAKPLIAPVIQAAKPAFLKGISFLSGYADDVVKTALQRTPGAVDAAQRGEVALTDIVKRTAAKLQTFATDALQNAKDTISTLSKESSGGAGQPGTRQGLLDHGRQFVDQITSTLRNTNIGVKSDGALLFERPTLPSNIVSRADQGAVQDAYNLAQSIGKDTTIKNIDAVLERMLSLKAKTPAGSPTGAETRALIGGMMDEVVKFARSLGNLSPAYTKYADFLEENLPQRVFINDAKDIFGTSAHLSAEEVTQITTKLLGLFNSGKSETLKFAGNVGAKIGEDIPGGVAGTLVKAGDQVSMRANNLTKRGVVEKIVEAIPRAIIRHFIATGNITGLSTHPIIKATASRLKMPAEVLAQDVVGLFEQRSSN